MASQAKVDYGEVEAPQTMNKGPPNSNSTMFRGDRRYFIVEPYSSLDADIILVASDTSAPNWGESTGPPRAFKVHKERLRAASAVFTDMLDCGDEGSIKEGGELPYLQLTEPSAVIRALLGGVYPNEREKIVPLESLHWQLCKQVWEAAKKFELHMLSAYAGDILV